MVTKESISHYWNYAELLNEQLGKTANYVEPDKHNYGTYSTTYTNILLSACSEIEVVAKMICQIIDPDTDYLSTEVLNKAGKYSLQGTTQGRYLTGGVPPVRFSM